MRFHRFLFTISCLISLSVISTFSQTYYATTGEEDFRSEPQPGVTPAEILEIGSAKASIAAFQTGLHGRVTVRVLIDEAGNVSSVESVSGPGNICPSATRPNVVAARDAASTAARIVKFVPAKMSDQPMASAGWLYFDIGNSKPPVKDADGKDTGSRGTDKGERYTAVGNAEFKGPVNTQGTGQDASPVPIPKDRYIVGGLNHPSTSPGGVLNGKARYLPKPPYPPAARAVRASGAVTIQVLIDEDGSTFSAEAVSGHPLLRAASRNAACNASFSPTLLSGHAVRVSGIITYNFIP